MRIFKIMSKNSRAFRTTIGMSLQQFDFLIRDVEKHSEAEQKRLGRTASGGSARAARSPCICGGMVLLALMYCRTYLIQDGMTRLFGISQGSISTNIAKIIPPYGSACPSRGTCARRPKSPPP